MKKELRIFAREKTRFFISGKFLLYLPPSPYDLDGDGVLTLNDITVLINVYLEGEP